MRRAPVEPSALPPDAQTGREIEVPPEPAHYLRDVLRMTEGDEVELFDGAGRVVRGVIAEASAEVLRLRVTDDQLTASGESPLHLTVYQAIPKGDRWEWLIEKVTEVGVARIVPLETRRTIVRIKHAKVEAKRTRWSKIAASAARQCERAVVPEVTAPMKLEAALQSLDEGAVALVGATEDLATGEDAPGLAQALGAGATRVALFVGPEGGWEADELEALVDAGVRAFRCGPRILRSETAGVVCAALLQHIAGDL